MGLPAVATVSRWLKRWGLAKGRPPTPAGPMVLRRGTVGARGNEVWTVDFKGRYRTGDGTRVDPLTVRDLYSRYGIRFVCWANQSMGLTRREFVRIFKQYGLPRRIRCDNGTPFGAGGPTGLTRLSAWWVKLGIEVEFITPGRPCENGAHEQFHRVYKAEVARNPARGRGDNNDAASAGCSTITRSDRMKHWDGSSGNRYRKSRRSMPKLIKPWTYPKGWVRRWVKGNGEISWRGKWRFVGEAFVRDYVGLKMIRWGVWRVYFGPILVGELHERERGNIRTAKYRTH